MKEIPTSSPGGPLAGRVHERPDVFNEVVSWARWWAQNVCVAQMRPGQPVEVTGELAAAMLILLDCQEPGRRPAPAGIHPHQVSGRRKRERISVADRRDRAREQHAQNGDHSGAPSLKSLPRVAI